VEQELGRIRLQLSHNDESPLLKPRCQNRPEVEVRGQLCLANWTVLW